MNKKYIIGAVVITLSVWAGFFWGKKSAVAPVNTESVSSVKTPGALPVPAPLSL